MAVIYGRTVGFGNAGGIIPPQPNDEDYVWYRTITATQNLTINKPGWYKIYVIGNGGNGGSGPAGHANTDNHDERKGASGGGGGTGGYAVTIEHLTNNDVLEITMDSTKNQVKLLDYVVYAENGGAGGTGGTSYWSGGATYSASAGQGGTAGNAAGGNVLNYSGHAGYPGTPSRVEVNGGANPSNGGNSGVGTGPDGSTLKYKNPTATVGGKYNSRNGNSATGSTTGTATLLGGAGSGGMGGDQNNTSQGVGGSGYIGGIVLEIVED